MRWAAAVVGLFLAASAEATTFLYTVPDRNQGSVVLPPELRETPSDSLARSCDLLGEPTADADTSRLWGWPSGGGGPRVVLAHSVFGRGGQTDSFVVSDATLGPYSWLFWVEVADTAGNPSCSGNTVRINGTVTSVEIPTFSTETVARCYVYDVRGRLVAATKGGLYYEPVVSRSVLRSYGVTRRLAAGFYYVKGRTIRGTEKPPRKIVLGRGG